MLTVKEQIGGLPCYVRLTAHRRCPPDLQADEPHGYDEVEFDVLDMSHRPSKWLEARMDEDDRERIAARLAALSRDDDRAEMCGAAALDRDMAPFGGGK